MTTRDTARFIAEHEAALRPLLMEEMLATWEASTTGDAAAARRAARAGAEVRKLYADPVALARIRHWLRGAPDLDPLLRRQFVLLEHQYTANQLPAEMIDELEDRAREIEQVFHTFRAEVAGNAASENEIRRLLEDEGDTRLRREAWEASKAIGALVAEPLRDLARRRNEAARRNGFPDYYAMRLELQEIRPAELDRIADDVERSTDAPFAGQKTSIDAALARRFGIAPAAVRPWHFADPFFQEPPAAGDVDLDPLFSGRDVVDLARRYFAAIGLPIADVVERSDLFERPAKDQHAFCIDIDRAGDVRILCNIRDNARWMGTILHELGHAAYDRFLPASLPFLLRCPSHTLTTEAIAMCFGALVRDADWLADSLALPPADHAALQATLPASRRRDLLVFARWALVMIRFERAFYQNPDRSDLNEVWWSLARSLQGLAPPPLAADRHDWATKIHLAIAPVYYHNYLLGELFAAQLRGALHRRGATGPALGAFLREEVFRHGAVLRWDELVLRSTGESLSARDFVRSLRTDGDRAA